MIQGVREFLRKSLSPEIKLWLLKWLKEVTFGGLRRKVLVSHHWHRSRLFNVGPEDISKQRVSVVVDLGANVGDFTKVAAGFADEVHAFEPEPSVFEILKADTAHLDNVHVYNAAVSAEDGRARLYRGSDFKADRTSASFGSSLVEGHASLEGGDFVETEQVGIETLLKRIGRPVDILKVDIEGAEVPLLERLFQSPTIENVRQLYVETHEHVLPELAERTEALRKRARNIDSLTASFDWH